MSHLSIDTPPGIGPERSRRRQVRRAHRRRRRILLISQAAILTLVVLGLSAFSSTHKAVAMNVNGKQTSVTTYAQTVGQLLDEQHISTGKHDMVVPSASSPVPSNGEVVVRTAHPLTVTVDGSTQQVWSTALNVDEELVDLGVDPNGAAVSASGTTPISDISSLNVSTDKSIEVMVDGQVIDGKTNAATVGQALNALGVEVGDQDVVSVNTSAPTVNNMLVQVSRAVASDGTQMSTVNYKTVNQNDPDLPKGTTQVVQQGKAGTMQTVYRNVTVDGVVVSKQQVSQKMVSQPVDEIVKVGTKDVSNVNDPNTSKQIAKDMLPNYGWSQDQFSCLDSLWTRESGWSTTADNPSSDAYGIPQALPGSKMASVGPDWETNPTTQITWGLNYIAGRYGTPCGAWSVELEQGWY